MKPLEAMKIPAVIYTLCKFYYLHIISRMQGQKLHFWPWTSSPTFISSYYTVWL